MLGPRKRGRINYAEKEEEEFLASQEAEAKKNKVKAAAAAAGDGDAGGDADVAAATAGGAVEGGGEGKPKKQAKVSFACWGTMFQCCNDCLVHNSSHAAAGLRAPPCVSIKISPKLMVLVNKVNTEQR